MRRVRCIKDVVDEKGNQIFSIGHFYAYGVKNVKREGSGDDYLVYYIKDFLGREKILYSVGKTTSKNQAEREFLQEHFDLTDAPKLREAAGLLE